MTAAVLVLAIGDMEVRKALASPDSVRRLLKMRAQAFQASLREYVLTGETLYAGIYLRPSDAPKGELGREVTKSLMYNFLDVPASSEFSDWERAAEVAEAEMSRLDAEVEKELAAEDAEEALAGVESLA